jgi:predicted transcriptional regulator
MAEKTLKTFRLSEDTLSLLKQLAELHTRTEALMIEALVKEAAKKEKLKP